MKQFKRLISLLLVLCMVLSVAPVMNLVRAAEADADLWIDPVNGDDTNDGTTEDTAFKTIDAAKTKAAELSANGDVVVVLKAGTYDATETIKFGEAESGKNGHTITYRAESGETALISGGEQLDGWTLHDAAHNIYVADIPEGTELIRQFYVDGEPQPMASMELTPKDLSTFTSYGYESGSNSSADTSVWLRVDLGEGKLVSSVTLYGDDETSQTTGKAMGFPEDFIIETSTDGLTWTTQVTETGFSAPAPLGGVEFNFSSTAAQYIRIKASKLGNPLTNSQTGGISYYMAFTEVQVGFSSKAKAVNLGVAQHVDLDSAVASASNAALTAGTPKEFTIGSSAKAIAGFTLNVDASYVGTTDNIKIQAYTNGAWKTVYSKNGYTWKQDNTFAINPIAATKVRVISAQDMTISTLTVHQPAELSGSVTAIGLGSSYLMDNAFDGSYNSGSQTSAIYKNNIVVNLGSVQDVGAVRLWPTYNGTVPAGYMTAATIQVSTDGVTYHTVLELPEIQTPTGGAQTLVLPRGYKAQYVKIQPMLLDGDGVYSLQLDELDIVPSKVEAIYAEDDTSNIVTKKNYTMISTDGVTPRLGYYTDVNGSFIDYAVDEDEAECIIDNQRSYGYTSTFTYNELVQWGGSKVPSFLLELPAATTIGAIELAIDPDIWSAPLNYEIQVYTGGTWKTVATETDPQWVDKLQPQPHYTERYEFDEVSVTAARILVYNLTMQDGTYPESSISANPAGYTTDFCLNEFTLFQVEELTYEEQPDVDADTVVYNKINLSNANVIGFGYYNNTALESFTSYNDGSGSKIFDGNYDTYGATHGLQYQWIPPLGPLVPALVLNTVKGGKPSTINAIELAVREDGFCAPYDFEIQVTTSADKDNWTTVAKEESKDWKVSNKVTFKFPEMDVYKVRLVATLLTPASNITEDQWAGATTTNMHISEFTLYNINDPTNPIAADLVSQGEGVTGSVIYDARGATASAEASAYKANRAVDGFIEPTENAGLSVSSDAKYNFSYLKHPEHVEMHTLYLWYHRIQHVSDASLDGTEIYLDGGMGVQSEVALMPTWFSNDYLFIDTPGEWYIDRYEGKIYYMADGTMDNKVATLPVTDKIIDMEYASNITFEGITFSHTSWTYPSTNEYRDQQAGNYLENNTWVQVPAGIDLTGCTNVVFDGVQIRNMGTAGIRIKSDGVVISDGCKVLNSLVCDISYSGIVVGEVVAHHGYRAWQLVKNATIQNNFVTRIGIDMFDSVGIFAAYTNGVVIDHNEVSYTPYSGISMGWGWSMEEENNSAALTEVGNNKITYNYVHDVCRTNYDGGAIYTLGWQEGSEIAYNYIHDSGSNSTKTENGIYLDEGTAYMQVHHNVIDTVAQCWLQIWKSNIHNNTSTNNYYNSSLSTRGIYVNGAGNTTSGNTSFSSLSSNSTAQSIANSAGLTDKSIKTGEDKGFVRQHDIGQDFWTSADYARYIDDARGWYNVRISGQVGRTYYDTVNKIVTIVMPEGTDLSSLALQYSNESGWNVKPGTGVTQDFTNPVTYTITSSGGSITKNWTVNVITEPDNTVAPEPPVDDDPSVPTIPTQAPTEPPKPVEGFLTGTYLDIIPESSLLAYVGDYVNGNFDTLANQNPGEAALLIDAAISSAGWIGSASTSGTQAAVIEVTGGAKLIGGVELIARNADKLTGFELQVKKTDGTWVSVANETGAFDGTCTEMLTFDPIEGTAIRVLCNSWSSNRPMLQEITLFEAKSGNVLQEVVPSSVTANKGPLSPEQTADNIIDGDRGSYGNAYYQTNQMPVEITFDMTKDGAPSNVTRMIMYAYGDSRYTAANIKLEVQTEAGGAWTTLYADIAYETGFEDTFVLDFDQPYDAYSMRLTVNNSIADTLILPEVEFFGYVSNEVQEDVQLPTPDLTEVSKTDSSITVSAPAVTGGTVMYRIDGGAWQTSGTFTNLQRYTKYAIEAMYVGSKGYADSLPALLEIRTERTQLPAVTGFEVVEVTENSITVTGDTIEGGNLQFRIDGGSWTAGGTFTNLTSNTTYIIEARYNRKNTSYSATVEADYVSVEVTTKESVTVVVGASYSIHLIEPWALRTYITFATTTESNPDPNPIQVSTFTEYGAYAIIGNKFEGTTVEELMADPDAVKYTSALGNITASDATTLTFDFYDGLYSYNLDESIYWVAYFETADGTHYTSLQQKSLTEVADSLIADNDVPDSEKAILDSMQTLKDAVVDLRGENADLGHTYAPGAANPGTLGDRNTGYMFGTSHQMKLIEPWGVRVRVIMRDKASNALADYENADDYGLIFFHDKTGKYGGTMTSAQLKAETGAKVYSKLDGSAVINAGGVTAIYDHEIFTYDLDTELYGLPYIVIDGNYYYPSTVTCWNLLTEITEFSQDETLDPEEIAVFEAMLEMYNNVQNHRN